MRRLIYGRRFDAGAEEATILWFMDQPDRAVQLDERIVALATDEGLRRRAWKKFRARTLEKWIAESPGTRPSAWWEYDAPRQPRGSFPGCYYDGKLAEPRQQLSGAGVPAFQVLNLVPAYAFGLQKDWADYNEADPPTFEAQAAYLKRHGLMTASEARGADYRPEVLSGARLWDSRPWREVAKEHILARVAAGEETAERAARLLGDLR
jgi:hypothetical protein